MAGWPALSGAGPDEPQPAMGLRRALMPMCGWLRFEPEADGKRDVLEGRFSWLALEALRLGTKVRLLTRRRGGPAGPNGLQSVGRRYQTDKRCYGGRSPAGRKSVPEMATGWLAQVVQAVG